MRFPTTRTTLIDRLNDDEAAWTDFFDRYKPVIVDLGGFKGLSPDECEDLVQNVMIRFNRKIAAGFQYNKSLAKFRTFFCGLIKGCIYDLLRQRSRLPIPVDELPEMNEGEVPDEILDLLMLEKWREVMKTEALAELANRVDEKTFQAFDLYGLQNRPMREVAKLLNCSSASIYMAKNRCVKIMREIVRKLNTEDGALKLDE